jgi:AcrR family transcriptional regulator
MDVLEQVDKIDPRVRRTRGYIQGAFRELLNEKGFKSITVREITERADVNRATFYAHYADKYELLNVTLEAIFQEELERRALNVCQYSEANLRALMITVCEFIRDANTNCKSVDSQFELIVENQVRQQIRDLLTHWLDHREMKGDVTSMAVATSWTIYGLAEQWNQKANQEEVETYTDRVLPLILGNMGG